jgi:glycosyltransferase involved in cell wall biosynthesis
VPDVVTDGVDGHLVGVGDTSAAAMRLAELASDTALRQRMGDAGAARVVQRYRVPRLVEDVDRLYRSLLAGRRPATAR